MNFSLRSVVLVTLLLIGTNARAQIVTYNFNAGSLAGSNGTGASSSAFSVSDGSFTSTAFTTESPPNSPAIADSGSWNALSPTKYFSFTVTPLAGYTLSLTTLTFDYRQTGTGALNYTISAAGTQIGSAGTFTRDSTWRSVNHALNLSNITTATEIRIYGYGGGSGSFGIDTVTLNGTASIPEPSTYALVFGALALACAVIHRRRGKGRLNETF